jgi:hypothetical protein
MRILLYMILIKVDDNSELKKVNEIFYKDVFLLSEFVFMLTEIFYY